MNSVEIKSVDEPAVRRAVDAYVATLFEQDPNVVEVVVFGSFEAGTYAPGSDVDLFILLDHADRPVRERIPQLMPDRFPVGLDLFPFTHAEAEQLAGSPVLEAVRLSRWRYRRPGAGSATVNRD